MKVNSPAPEVEVEVEEEEEGAEEREPRRDFESSERPARLMITSPRFFAASVFFCDEEEGEEDEELGEEWTRFQR